MRMLRRSCFPARRAASRNLVDLVDYRLRRSTQTANYAKAARGMISCSVFRLAKSCRSCKLSLAAVRFYSNANLTMAARGIISCSLRSRNLVDLVDYRLRRSTQTANYAKAARGIISCSLRSRNLVDLVNYRLRRYVSTQTRIWRWLRGSCFPARRAASRNLVDLVNYRLRRYVSFQTANYANATRIMFSCSACRLAKSCRSCKLSPAAVRFYSNANLAMAARGIISCSLRSRNLVDLVDYRLRRYVSTQTRIWRWLCVA